MVPSLSTRSSSGIIIITTRKYIALRIDIVLEPHTEATWSKYHQDFVVRRVHMDRQGECRPIGSASECCMLA